MGTNAEKRSLKRLQHESMVMLQQPEKGLYVYGRMLNYSRKGMYLEADFMCQPGTRVVIHIPGPLAKSSSKAFTGEVRWCRMLPKEQSDCLCGLGVRLG
jgi:hypothetical protein